MKLFLSIALSLIALQSSAFAGDAQPVTLSERDTALLGEAYHLVNTLGETLWPGWSAIELPVVYVSGDSEFAVGFSKKIEGFRTLPAIERLPGKLQVRKRTFSPQMAASFYVEGVPAVIIGTPEALETGPTDWVLTAAHEMFHVLQYRRGSGDKVAALEIGPRNDPSWQLDFPYPYDDSDVMRLMHLEGYTLFLAVTADESDAKYNTGAALEAAEVLRSFLRERTGDDRAFDYARFQEWNEGVARYTEHRLAELAATGDYRPTAAFAALEDAESFGELWESEKSQAFLVKHAGRAARSRTVFYHVGLGKELALDRVLPGWKETYFAPDVWLDDLLAEATGK